MAGSFFFVAVIVMAGASLFVSNFAALKQTKATRNIKIQNSTLRLFIFLEEKNGRCC